MSYHDILFPPCLEVFLAGKSIFSTSKVISLSGREIRSLDHDYNREQYLLKDCFLSQAEFLIFNNFFKARRGSRFAFLLKDFVDSSVQKQILGIGDGMQKEFQLYKSYDDEKYPYVRKINKIQRDSLKLYIEKGEIQNWELNQDTGMITLENSLKLGSILCASFEFYVIVRFADDSFDYESRSDGTIEILNVSLIEVIE